MHNTIRIAKSTLGETRDNITLPITSVLNNNMYKGRRCFILGGGPSLESFDFSRISTEISIGINKSFINFPCTINYAMDENFYRTVNSDQELRTAFANYKGIKVWVSKRGIAYKRVYVIQRIRQKNILSLDLNAGINPGNNSGWGALNLAMALGCNPIYLLGYDFYIDKDKTHWHSGYNKNIKSFERLLASFVLQFEFFSAAIQALGFTVVNLNRRSALECFMKDDINNVI